MEAEKAEIEVVDEKSKEIQQVTPVDNSPMAAVAAALQNNPDLDIDKFGKFFELQLKHEANEARKAFISAMTNFKEDPPIITKDRSVHYVKKDDSEVDYNHSSLSNATATINKSLSEHGLASTWFTGHTEKGQVKVTCRITHILGHYEETTICAPPDASGGKNPIQAIASTISYLERYTLFAATGLASGEMDDDGADAGDNTVFIDPPTEAEWECIDLIIEKLPNDEGDIDREKLAKWFLADQGSYPATKTRVGDAAEYVVQKSPKNIYVTFEDKYQLETE